jgi:2-keto-3-deoxy-6-phosphogluconate aldolase
VLDALHRVLDAALDAGAAAVEVTLQVPRDAREDA